MSSYPNIQTSHTPASREMDRDDLAIHIYGITALLFGAAAVTFLLTFVFQPIWQIFALAIVFLVSALINLVFQSQVFSFVDNPVRRVIYHCLSVQIPLIILASLISRVGPISSAIILIHVLLITASLQPARTNLTILLGLATSLMSVIVSIYSPLRQLSISSPPEAYVVVISVLGLLFLISLGMMTIRFISRTLGMKLITLSIAIALLPLIFISAIQSTFTSTALRDQTNQALGLAASQTATKVDDFLKTNLQSITNESQLAVFIDYLSLAPSKRADSQVEQELKLTIDSIVAQSGGYLSSFAVLNIDGKDVFDSNPLEIGKDEEKQDYFIRTVQTGQVYISPILYSGNNDPYLYFAAPVRNNDQQLIGVLRARYDAFILQSLLEPTTNLIGARSYPVLLDENNIRIADQLTPNLIFRSITPLQADTLKTLQDEKRLPNLPAEQYSSDLPGYLNAITNVGQEKYFSTQALPNDTRHIMFGTVTTLVNKPWKVVFLKEQSDLQSLLSNQRNNSLLLAAVIAAVVALFSTLFGSSLSRPIIQLKSTADRISTGDLSAAAIVRTSDEIGSLGNAFNIMTQRLRESIYELEDRVNERTAALATQNLQLQYRSQQLLTVSDVAREIASTQELGTLLEQITRLISERFNFYHVGIFLIDEKREYAYLRAANSEGGQRMLARNHKLRVGQVGMVGFVTGTGSPRISTDVGQDAVFFNNPDLPLTRSEMTLPLKVGINVIGALDVQSSESNAFTDEDVKLFTTMADQVAIAIQNNELYAQTAIALEEAQNLHRQYLNQEWQRETGRRQFSSYMFTSSGVNPVTAEITPEINRVFNSGESIITDRSTNSDASAASMDIPIKLRGMVIGVIQLQQAEASDHPWSENEIATVQSVADQVGQALENARLFEQTVRRAERERRALDITNKIRSTNDPQAMLEIAIIELQRALGTNRAQIFIQAETPATTTITDKDNGASQKSPEDTNGRKP